MKVIMLSNIEKVGNQGEVVTVKRGFARNYLVPRNLAIYATPQNMKKLGAIQSQAAQEEQLRLAELKTLADQISALNLVFVRKVDEHDHMFGSVSETDITAELAGHGIEIHKSAVQMEKHIKELGAASVQIRLHKDIVADLHLVVEKEGKAEEPVESAVSTPEPEPEPNAPEDPVDETAEEEEQKDTTLDEDI